MRRLRRWLLKAPPSEVKPHTLAEVDRVLAIHAKVVSTSSDPLDRWASIRCCDVWLDTRIALMKGAAASLQVLPHNKEQ